MANEVTTHTDEGFNDRIAAIANRIAFGIDVDGLCPLDVIAARMLLADRESD